MAEIMKTDSRDTCSGQQRVKGAMEQIACMQRFPLRITKHEVLIQLGCACRPASFLLAKMMPFEHIDSQGGELNTSPTRRGFQFSHGDPFVRNAIQRSTDLQFSHCQIQIRPRERQ